MLQTFHISSEQEQLLKYIAATVMAAKVRNAAEDILIYTRATAVALR
jgi:hypothetical protein